MSANDPHIIIIKDESKYIFGGFTNEEWRPNRIYYGNGECFLFTFKDTEIMECFYPAGRNEYFMISDAESVSMGAGGLPGIYLASDLMHGSSGTSDTYLNPRLSYKEDFFILDMEVWALV